jgi:hypothetical protein
MNQQQASVQFFLFDFACTIAIADFKGLGDDGFETRGSGQKVSRRWF